MKKQTKSEKMSEFGLPFVGHIIPFVCHSDPAALPLIGYSAPFVPVSRKNRGFTLVELLVTVVIAGILAAIASPALKSMYDNNEIVSQTNDLMADLAYTRSEAIKRDAQVSICPSTNQTTCSGSSNWSTGWIVFVDANHDNAVDSTSDTILRVGNASASNMTITAYHDSGASTLATTGLIYTADGTLYQFNNTTTDSLNYRLCFVDPNIPKTKGRTITVSVIGQTDFSEGC